MSNRYIIAAFGLAVGITAIALTYLWSTGIPKKEESPLQIPTQTAKEVEDKTVASSTLQTPENSMTVTDQATNKVKDVMATSSGKSKQELIRNAQENLEKTKQGLADMGNIIYTDNAMNDAWSFKTANKTTVGVCADEHVADNLSKINAVCRDDETGFVFYAQNTDGSYICGDVRGFTEDLLWSEPKGVNCGVGLNLR